MVATSVEARLRATLEVTSGRQPFDGLDLRDAQRQSNVIRGVEAIRRWEVTVGLERQNRERGTLCKNMAAGYFGTCKKGRASIPNTTRRNQYTWSAERANVMFMCIFT